MCISTDKDECTDGTAQCEDICQNTPGSYICRCNPGYEIASDGYSCQGSVSACNVHGVLL